MPIFPPMIAALYPRLAAVLLASLAALMLGAGAWPVWSLRASLQAEQAERHAELALSLAQAWAPLASDAQALQAAAEARWASGREDRIVVRWPSGKLLTKLERSSDNPAIPAWFVEACGLAAVPGLARIGDGPALEVQAGMGRAQTLLWDASSRAAAGVALCGLLCAGGALLLLHRALKTGTGRLRTRHFTGVGPSVPVAVAAAPEGAEWPQALTATVQGLRADLAHQAEQVSRLRRQAQVDAMTGLALRHHFLELLQQRLSLAGENPGQQAALLLVRIPGLSALNLRLGHAATDQLLCAAAHVLLTYVDRVPGTVAGRLNGSDFALCLPVAGLAAETALSLRETLAALPAMRTAGAVALVGGIDDLPAVASGVALAEADAALARAEAGEGGGVAVDQHGDQAGDGAGATVWQAQIGAALSDGRALLTEEPVCDRGGRILHRRCSLRLQLGEGRPFQPAKVWGALARRGGLLPRADLLTLRQVLLALAHDGQARGVRLSAESLLSARHLGALLDLLRAAPTEARRLWVEIAELDRLEAPQDLAPALSALRAAGVQLGVAHAGAKPQALSALPPLGFGFVTVGGQHLRGVAADAALRDHAQGLFKLLRGLGLVVLADRVVDRRDRELLWAWGLAGATRSTDAEDSWERPLAASSSAVAVAAEDPAEALQLTSPACSV
jgi:GGDEF domain-containing protein/EAL domain-containing protein (putative c-di-GMP-specific phosphodiesterase class I)